MVSHCQESTIEFGHALDSWFRHFASCIWYCKKTWNRAKTIFGVPSILPPPKKIHFLPSSRDFLRKKVCGFSNRQLQENVFNRANLFGGGNLYVPPIQPPKSSVFQDGVKKTWRKMNKLPQDKMSREIKCLSFFPQKITQRQPTSHNSGNGHFCYRTMPPPSASFGNISAKN